MRVALIGAGRVGRLHAQIPSSLLGVGAVLVADANPAAARSVAEPVGRVALPTDEAAMKRTKAVVIRMSEIQ